MDPEAKVRKQAVDEGWQAPTTYGRGRALRLDPEVYSTAVPIHLTLCAEQGEPFLDHSVAVLVCNSVETSARLLKQELIAYCLMPDHLHVIMSPADSRTAVSEFLRKMKSFTTNRYQKIWPAAGLQRGSNPGAAVVTAEGPPACDQNAPRRLWQYSARDRVKRAREDLKTLVEYVANNPVRRGLVRCWTNWPYTRIFVDL
jgi:REP element-mobilizing transposase RayT